MVQLSDRRGSTKLVVQVPKDEDESDSKERRDSFAKSGVGSKSLADVGSKTMPSPGVAAASASGGKKLSMCKTLDTRELAKIHVPRDPRWANSEGYLKAEIAESLRVAAQTQAAHIPRNASETRLARLRLPSNSLGQMMRNGEPMEAVADQAALRLIERWTRVLLDKHVPVDCLATVIAELVHDDGEKQTNKKGAGDTATPFAMPTAGVTEVETTPLPGGFLGLALKRLVPEPDVAAAEGWNYLEDLMEAIDLETNFDKKSWVHKPRPPGTSLLSLSCHGPPPVWSPGSTRTTFPQNTFISKAAANSSKVCPGMRATAVLLSAGEQCKVHESSKMGAMLKFHPVPGPAEYKKHLKLSEIQSPRKGAFASTGWRRPVCTVDSLSHRPRMKGDLF